MEPREIKISRKIKNPITCFNKIESLKEDMRTGLHDIVWMLGKKVEEKGEVNYVLKFKKSDHVIIHDDNGKTCRVKEVKILSPDTCQVQGHMIITTENNEVLSVDAMKREIFNIYEPAYSLYLNA